MKTLARLTAAGLLCLALGACSPQEWIQNVFGPDADAATSVAMCESTMNPAAVSPGGSNHGLFQINTVHRDTFTAVTGQSWDQIYSAEWNTKFAKYLYDRQGWTPWSCQP